MSAKRASSVIDTIGQPAYPAVSALYRGVAHGLSAATSALWQYDGPWEFTVHTDPPTDEEEVFTAGEVAGMLSMVPACGLWIALAYIQALGGTIPSHPLWGGISVVAFIVVGCAAHAPIGGVDIAVAGEGKL